MFFFFPIFKALLQFLLFCSFQCDEYLLYASYFTCLILKCILLLNNFWERIYPSNLLFHDTCYWLFKILTQFIEELFHICHHFLLLFINFCQHRIGNDILFLFEDRKRSGWIKIEYIYNTNNVLLRYLERFNALKAHSSCRNIISNVDKTGNNIMNWAFLVHHVLLNHLK